MSVNRIGMGRVMTDPEIERLQAADRWLADVCGFRPSCALSLLALWERPWSSNALRWANHALVRAYRAGLDVLETHLDPERPINAIERTW